MSLINDAIKRASQTAPSAPVTDTPPAFKPAEPTRSRSSYMPLAIGVVGLCLLLCLGTLLVLKSLKADSRSDVAQSQPTPVKESVALPAETTVAAAMPTPPPAAPPVVEPPPVSQEKLAPSVPQPASQEIPAAPESAPLVASSSKEPAPLALTTNLNGLPPGFPQLKLQGIFYRRTRPSAMINARTVFANDVVNGATVVDIERNRVKVVWKGHEQVLRMH